MCDSAKGYSFKVLGILATAFLAFNVQAGEGKSAGQVSFSDVDADGNGCISEEEFTRFHGKMHGKGNMHGKGHGHGGNKGQGNGCCAGKGMKHKMPSFDDFDLDGDGKITESELNQGRAKRMSEMAAEGRQLKHAAEAPSFADIDSDGDGGISADEFAAHQAEHQKKMQKNKNASEQ